VAAQLDSRGGIRSNRASLVKQFMKKRDICSQLEADVPSAED
jgi:hypothetical protein